MSVVLMPNYYYHPFRPNVANPQYPVQNWTFAHMAHYPPPPQPDQQHYNALYPASGGAQQLVDPQEQLQYSSLNQSIYPKVESGTAEQPSSSQQIHNLAQELQQHALGEQQRQDIQQVVQHVQHHTPHGQTPPGPHPSQISAHQSTPDQISKANRLRKACDSCSIRKVKCDESGPPCRACAALDIPCTFDRPSRRRGPPNRHAEAIKRRRIDDPGESPHISGRSSPSSPTHAAQALAALSSHTSNQQLSAESICPVETLDLLIDDFFTYIHPLCPFPHEPSFREAWKNREDLNNNGFLALLASMIGALVASFPRKPRLHLKAQRRDNLFPNHLSLVNRCQRVCAMARGPGYLENENLFVFDAATSYFLALMGVYTFKWRQGRLYFGECLTIIRTLGLHKAKGQTHTRLGSFANAVGSHSTGYETSRDKDVDNITLEIGRRIFWTMFVSVRSMQAFGADFPELVIPTPTSSNPYPPLPAEVDDFCIYPTHIEPQPVGLLPMIAGFNANVRAYTSYTSLSIMETSWGEDVIVDWDRQRRVLHESLRRCKDAMSQLPPQLLVHPRHHTGRSYDHSNGPSTYPGFAQPHMSKDPASSLMSPTHRTEDHQNVEQRRDMQYEIQKANIYASSLSTRSYIVEKYWNLRDTRSRSHVSSHPNSPTPGTGITAAALDGLMPRPPTSNPDTIEQEMQQERESIVRDLLVVLSSIDEVNMEPNADSFTMKIRSIASTLLDAPDQRKGQIATEAQEYLSAFLKILMRLERVSPANSDPDQPEDEEAELRAWADLREYQMKFAQQGGLMGLS